MLEKLSIIWIVVNRLDHIFGLGVEAREVGQNREIWIIGIYFGELDDYNLLNSTLITI
jgi:hypothetical protein